MIRLRNSSIAWKGCGGALLLLLAVVLCGRINHPWTYNDDYNGAFWSQAAHNFWRDGYLTTAGVPAPLYFGPPPIPSEDLYVHHPTLLAAMMYADRALLGESEWAARSLPIGFSLLTAALLWTFVSWCAGWRAGAFTLAFFVAAPMELHYGQMVNFEAPELFFLLAALCFFHLWQARRTWQEGSGLLPFCALAMATDWEGYLLAGLLAAQSFKNKRLKMGFALCGTCLGAGLLFLAQIHFAVPGAWSELLHAFRERSGNANPSGGTFTARKWIGTQFTYLTTLFHPAAWILALIGGFAAALRRSSLSSRERAIIHSGAVLFVIDAFYVCVLPNQSYIHDFAGFYFVAPIAIFAGLLIEWILRATPPGRTAIAATSICSLLAGVLIWSGIRKLEGIDTQFCILDDDSSEPPNLMPELGRFIDRVFPPDAVVICNFDPYYSPLPYYARRVMVNDVQTYAEFRSALSDAASQPKGAILWLGAPDAGAIADRLPIPEEQVVTFDKIKFLVWIPRQNQ